MCEILRLQNNYTFFRSTAHRPNLTYTVVPKPATGAAVVEDMAEFIHQNYPGAVAGIVYTGTKREANAVAEALCEYGIVARVRSVLYCSAMDAGNSGMRRSFDNDLFLDTCNLLFVLIRTHSLE